MCCAFFFCVCIPAAAEKHYLLGYVACLSALFYFITPTPAEPSSPAREPHLQLRLICPCTSCFLLSVNASPDPGGASVLQWRAEPRGSVSRGVRASTCLAAAGARAEVFITGHRYVQPPHKGCYCERFVSKSRHEGTMRDQNSWCRRFTCRVAAGRTRPPPPPSNRFDPSSLLRVTESLLWWTLKPHCFWFFLVG